MKQKEKGEQMPLAMKSPLADMKNKNEVGEEKE
jgi:hypothetical protein